MISFAALKLLLGGFLKKAGKFIADNRRWLLPLLAGLLLWWYVAHLQGQRDKAVRELAAYKLAVQQAAEARKAENARKEAAGKQLSIDIQQGATNAIKSVYDYYGKHPRIVYRDGVHQPAASDCAGLPETAYAAGDRDPNAADDGRVTAGIAIPIQVIEPDLLPRCADTTVQALECKRYVEGLIRIYSD